MFEMKDIMKGLRAMHGYGKTLHIIDKSQKTAIDTHYAVLNTCASTIYRFIYRRDVTVPFSDICKATVSEEREEAELQRLYKEALAEGGNITVFAGGDLPNTGSDIVMAFESKFAGTTYKPIGFKHAYAPYKDKDGHYWATNIFYFKNLISNTIHGKQRPIEAKDCINPKLKGGKIIYTYPHDDDAVLYQLMQLIKQNGLKWFKAFLAQKPLLKNLMSDTWSSRTDVPSPAGLKPIWKIKNPDPPGFYARSGPSGERHCTMEMYIGPVAGKSPLYLIYG
ncbi:hypothetical protein K493DRAFT_297316 [Basidiobolus meristosporus CBS 931.73]|uniref:Uncharacterized protein n=1 Tax=Basidiobolus meristosporus CBS 931.73 TaxID=1314790 RepID=A0A1Y1Z0I7_9FUNG|nr:hypothetical protein K493DRAFT_297316 [Basidiobolus meristosporus CBS 931.73]|eukprot:ORY03696.1 hypothetical protein K493DRAFT_297316 [Basidiobolus meristosporus CBS 931.73]